MRSLKTLYEKNERKNWKTEKNWKKREKEKKRDIKREDLQQNITRRKRSETSISKNIFKSTFKSEKQFEK